MTEQRELPPIRELFVSPDMAGALRLDAQRMPCWQVPAAQVVDLDLLLTGALFPLKGFQSQADCVAVARARQTESGLFWPVPFALSVSDGFAADADPGHDIALADQDGLLALMSVTDRWTDDAGGWLGGPVKGIRASCAQHDDSRPNALRQRFSGQAMAVAIWGNDDWADEQAGRLGALPHVILRRRAQISAAEALLQAIVARNCGATDLLIPAAILADPLLALHGGDAGIAIHDDASACLF